MPVGLLFNGSDLMIDVISVHCKWTFIASGSLKIDYNRTHDHSLTPASISPSPFDALVASLLFATL